jgi:hypothetical protein
MDRKLEDLVGAIQIITEHADLLSLEVEQLKAARLAFKAELQQTLQKEFIQLAPSFAKELSESFNQQTRPLITTPLESLQKIHQEAERATSVIKSMVIQSKTRLILMGISLVTAVCFSCFVMAAGFFYFFPQHYQVHYDVTMEQFKQMAYGKTLIHIFNKLKPSDQTLVLEALDDTLKQMSSTRPRA